MNDYHQAGEYTTPDAEAAKVASNFLWLQNFLLRVDNYTDLLCKVWEAWKLVGFPTKGLQGLRRHRGPEAVSRLSSSGEILGQRNNLAGKWRSSHSS